MNTIHSQKDQRLPQTITLVPTVKSIKIALLIGRYRTLKVQLRLYLIRLGHHNQVQIVIFSLLTIKVTARMQIFPIEIKYYS